MDTKHYRTIVYSNNNSERNSPEHRLWIAVLISFIDDLLRKNKQLDKQLARLEKDSNNQDLIRSIKRQCYSIKWLLNDANSKWIKFICAHIGVSHKWYHRHLSELAGRPKRTFRPARVIEYDI